MGRLDHSQAFIPEKLIAEGQAWALGWVPPVQFALFREQPTDADFKRYLAAQAKDIDEWPAWQPRCVIHHATASGSLSAEQRQLAADLINARREKLAAICLGYVFCTKSGVTRGLSKVIHWLAPPPYPMFNASTVTEALTVLRQVDARIEPAILVGRYRALFGDYLRRVSANECERFDSEL
jgi:hypothetical protein